MIIIMSLIIFLLELGSFNPILTALSGPYFEIDRSIEFLLLVLKETLEQLLPGSLVVHEILIQFLLLLHRVLVLPEPPLDRGHLRFYQGRGRQGDLVRKVVLVLRRLKGRG